MNLDLKNKNFIICGATSGFGLAITKQLVAEGAKVIAVARREEKLNELKDAYADSIETLAGDITQSKTIANLMKRVERVELGGVLINAAGPPAMKFVESSLDDWDEAYEKVLRWKVRLTQSLLPKFTGQGYGRLVYIESSSVKQPLENLALSTAMRLSVVGMVKTLSQEVPDQGVTFNVLAPGYHYTPAVERLFDKKAKNENISGSEARKRIENAIPLKKTGNVDNFASLAVWLLSPLSEYVTGQVYAVDGGVLKSTL